MATTTAAPPLWACDGCGLAGTEAEVNAHIDAHITLPDGTFRDPADITCWGSYEIGGPAWEAHTFHGVHPMTIVRADLDRITR